MKSFGKVMYLEVPCLDRRSMAGMLLVARVPFLYAE